MAFPLLHAEIDLSALSHNVRELRRAASPEARLMAVVKANAYGHGVAPVSRIALANGAERLGVARIEEGVAIRRDGLDAPVLVLGYTSPDRVDDLIRHNLDQAVFSVETARAYDAAARRHGGRIRLHIKIDTGMGRLGIMASDPAAELPSEEPLMQFRNPLKTAGRVKPVGFSVEDPLNRIRTILALKGVEVEGVFTHFASADSRDRSFADKQFARFAELLDRLHRNGMDIPLRHAANSAAILTMPETHLDMVRAGISLYGFYPSDEMDLNGIELRPAMTVKSRVIHVKSVPAGFRIGYGGTYETPRPTRIATVPVGYADGYNRRFSNRGAMLIHGQRAMVVGRVCMDLTMLDVGRIPDVEIEDEVVVMGRQGQEVISAGELASTLDTIHYEIVCAITERAPRVYLPAGSPGRSNVSAGTAAGCGFKDL